MRGIGAGKGQAPKESRIVVRRRSPRWKVCPNRKAEEGGRSRRLSAGLLKNMPVLQTQCRQFPSVNTATVETDNSVGSIQSKRRPVTKQSVHLGGAPVGDGKPRLTSLRGLVRWPRKAGTRTSFCSAGPEGRQHIQQEAAIVDLAGAVLTGKQLPTSEVFQELLCPLSAQNPFRLPSIMLQLLNTPTG